jgi:hypothetical protein
MLWVLIVTWCGWSDCVPREMATFPDKASCEEAAKQFEGNHYVLCGVKQTTK